MISKEQRGFSETRRRNEWRRFPRDQVFVSYCRIREKIFFFPREKKKKRKYSSSSVKPCSIYSRMFFDDAFVAAGDSSDEHWYEKWYEDLTSQKSGKLKRNPVTITLLRFYYKGKMARFARTITVIVKQITRNLNLCAYTEWLTVFGNEKYGHNIRKGR